MPYGRMRKLSVLAPSDGSSPHARLVVRTPGFGTSALERRLLCTHLLSLFTVGIDDCPLVVLYNCHRELPQLRLQAGAAFGSASLEVNCAIQKLIVFVRASSACLCHVPRPIAGFCGPGKEKGEARNTAKPNSLAMGESER